MRLILVVLVCFVCVAGGWSNQVQAEEPTWHKTPQDAQKVAAKQERHIVAFVRASWCGYCTKMEHDTWSDSALQKKVQDNFVPLLINADDYPELIERLRVRTFPTTMVFGPDGKLRDQVTGYQNATRINSLLDGVIAAAQRQANKTDGTVTR